jgi:mRNA interferase HigB
VFAIDWDVPFNAISKPVLIEFWQRHPDSKKALQVWFKAMKEGDYTSLTELKEAFVVDYVPPKYYVFDIKGNQYRLVALVNFTGRRVLIERVITHQEYNKWSKQTKR